MRNADEHRFRCEQVRTRSNMQILSAHLDESTRRPDPLVRVLQCDGYQARRRVRFVGMDEVQKVFEDALRRQFQRPVVPPARPLPKLHLNLLKGLVLFYLFSCLAQYDVSSVLLVQSTITASVVGGK